MFQKQFQNFRTCFLHSLSKEILVVTIILIFGGNFRKKVKR